MKRGKGWEDRKCEDGLSSESDESEGIHWREREQKKEKSVNWEEAIPSMNGMGMEWKDTGIERHWNRKTLERHWNGKTLEWKSKNPPGYTHNPSSFIPFLSSPLFHFILSPLFILSFFFIFLFHSVSFHINITSTKRRWRKGIQLQVRWPFTFLPYLFHFFDLYSFSFSLSLCRDSAPS